MLDTYLKYLVEQEGSDLHLKVGNRPIIRKNGELLNVDTSDLLNQEEMKDIVEKLFTKEIWEKFYENLNYDFSYSLSGCGRFRINISLSRGSYMLVARLIPFEIPTIESLKLPEILKEVVKEKNGIILVTGATGSGKSSTVASMVNYINQTVRKNIITFEDPIEFLFKDNKSIISQKEIPNDIRNFNHALKYVLRQDPDIIFLGELRDKDTVETALKASETGHLVISTLHTVNAPKTLSRLLDFFPSDRHKQLRHQLSDNLRAVLSQRLLKTTDGNKRVIMEIMRSTSTIRELMLTEDGMMKIPSIIKEGKQVYGMQTFDQNITEFYQNGIISYETAYENATVKTDIEMLKSGIISHDLEDFY